MQKLRSLLKSTLCLSQCVPNGEQLLQANRYTLQSRGAILCVHHRLDRRLFRVLRSELKLPKTLLALRTLV